MIAILGGTFNPIHNGHLHLAKQLQAKLNFESVRFMPAAIPALKDAPSVTRAQRAEMVDIAISEYPDFTLDTRELSRSGTSYTIDTLTLLREEILDSEDAIYEAIDLIEVSVHSLEKNRPQNSTKSELPSIPFEAELRRWRYLGVSQSAGSYRAFFHNGKTTFMVEMGGLLLGEWRLSNADKEAAIASYPLGKSLILKAAISE